jgi:hypothetical protein
MSLDGCILPLCTVGAIHAHPLPEVHCTPAPFILKLDRPAAGSWTIKVEQGGERQETYFEFANDLTQ